MMATLQEMLDDELEVLQEQARKKERRLAIANMLKFRFEDIDDSANEMAYDCQYAQVPFWRR